MKDSDIFEAHEDDPAPLLPILHAFHERDGHVSAEAIDAISDQLRIPKADLYGTVTFYHHLSREPGGQTKPRVCTGPVCCMRGAKKLVADLDADEMPCSGRCDAPIPVLIGNETRVAGPAAKALADLKYVPSEIPGPAHAEECVFAHIREPKRKSIKGYRQSGGYEALKWAVKNAPADIIAVIGESGLRGRGGAGFPTARKWQAVRDADGTDKTIICNADEGEPGCFKDRALMDYDPHALIEGMVIAGIATGATTGFIYLRYEYPETFDVLVRAMEEATKENFLGADILGTGKSFELHLRRGAGAYICGEETSLIESLEGKHPFPRNRPPYPVTHGFLGTPTAVNNVETLCGVAPILLHGAEWYQGLGLGEHHGTKLISLSGDIAHPGNYEVPIGLPLKTLLHEWAGGPSGSAPIQAVTMAGLSGGFIGGDDLDRLTLDEPSIRSAGSFLGAGGIMVFDASRDMFDVARQAMSFFAHESCGKCFPCRIGTKRLTERLSGEGPRTLSVWQDEVTAIGETMKATSACGLGVAAPLVTSSLMHYFGPTVEKGVALGNASTDGAAAEGAPS